MASAPGLEDLASGLTFMSYSTSTADRKSDVTVPSTLDWRVWWQAESRRCGSDWATLLARTAGVVGHLYSLHVVGASS
jgi:hypothetical protein